MRVEDALTQVRAIQVQVARTERYCCYRWATVAASGAVALAAAAGQTVWIPQPAARPGAFIALWVAAAALNVAIVGAEMLLRFLRSDSEFARRQTVSAVEQFAPCLVAGGLVTVMLRSACPEYTPLLPSLWSILFSLGIFASRRWLPRATILAAAYYLSAGLFCMRFAQGEQALAPWSMLVTFGAGQFLISFILHRDRELVHGDS